MESVPRLIQIDGLLVVVVAFEEVVPGLRVLKRLAGRLVVAAKADPDHSHGPTLGPGPRVAPASRRPWTVGSRRDDTGMAGRAVGPTVRRRAGGMTMSVSEQGWNGTPVSITTPWGDTLTVLEEDASHYGDVLETGVSWAYETRYLVPVRRAGRRGRGRRRELWLHHVLLRVRMRSHRLRVVARARAGHAKPVGAQRTQLRLPERRDRPRRRGRLQRVDLVVAQRNQLRQPCPQCRTGAQRPGLGSGRRRHRRRPLRGPAR